jgi:hypothetical protein
MGWATLWAIFLHLVTMCESLLRMGRFRFCRIAFGIQHSAFSAFCVNQQFLSRHHIVEKL